MNKLWITCERLKPGARTRHSRLGPNGGANQKMTKITSEEYLRALEETEPEEDSDGSVYTDEGPEEESEAERMAATAQGPKRRADGNVVGAEGWKRERPLTQSQKDFAQGVIEGKSLRQAYRDAYPQAQAGDKSISATAARLMKDPRIQRLIQDAWEETQEALADDMAATRRYVMRQLVTLSKAANQEGSRLKALELLGRSAGMWREQQKAEDRPITAAELKAQLAGHLRLVTGRRRANGAADVNEGAE